jgi:cytochrome b subunit of formate dehydrogenase
MEPSWIILTFVGIVVLIMMIYIFRQNLKDKKVSEQDLNRTSNFYEKESRAKDID